MALPFAICIPTAASLLRCLHLLLCATVFEYQRSSPGPRTRLSYEIQQSVSAGGRNLTRRSASKRGHLASRCRVTSVRDVAIVGLESTKDISTVIDDHRLICTQDARTRRSNACFNARTPPILHRLPSIRLASCLYLRVGPLVSASRTESSRNSSVRFNP